LVVGTLFVANSKDSALKYMGSRLSKENLTELLPLQYDSAQNI
jgi:hypothetical protein